MQSNKIFLIVFISLLHQIISGSDKYTIDYTIMNMQDFSGGVPTLQHISKQVVRANWNEAVNQTFELVEKEAYTQNDFAALQSILQYNQRLQSDACVIANIILPSIFEIEKENKQKIIDYMLNQKDSRAVIMALEHGLSLYDYKQAALKRFYTLADKAFTGLDLNKTLAHHQKLSHDALTIANLTLPSLFQLRDAASDTLINGGNQRLIDYIIDNDHTEGLLAMLEHGFDVCECDEKHNTLLHRLTEEYKPQLLELVLAFKKQNINPILQDNVKTQWVNMFNDKGRTALSYAAECASWDMIELLLNAGANPHLVDPDGKAALHHIASFDYNGSCDEYITEFANDTISLLLNAGLKINQPDNAGCAALHYVADPLVAVALLGAGADVNQVDNDGKTPLFYAKQKKLESVIPLLINAGSLIIEPASIAIKADNEQNCKHQK